jgi:hypothetical protein
MRTTEKIGPAYEVELTRENDNLVQVTVTATAGNALGYDELREATRQILDRVRPERRIPLPASSALNSPAMRALRGAHQSGQGTSSDEYLARLAVAYAEQAAIGRDPAARISSVLGLSTQTVKQHLVKARKGDFLTPTVEGQKGGEATDKARELIAKVVES